MDDDTRELIYLNCQSFEFFERQLLILEQHYFDALDQLLATCGNLTDMMLHREDYIDDEIIINKLKQTCDWGEKYITTSIKFEKEMQVMKSLAPDLRDSEIEFEGVENRFLFVSDYLDELKLSLMLQSKMRTSIEKQLKLFKGFNRYE